jgi:hypothetical protein
MEIEIVKEVCRRYAGCSKDYHVDPIPDRKAEGARRGLELAAGEEIVALIDFTLMGGASEAFVVIGSGICWKNIQDNAPRRLSWSELREKTPTLKKGIVTHEIDFGEGVKMSLSGAYFEGNKINQLIYLLCDLQKLDALILSNSPTDSRNEGSIQGYVTCEFCSGMVKSDVTYCKYCGIKLKG